MYPLSGIKKVWAKHYGFNANVTIEHKEGKYMELQGLNLSYIHPTTFWVISRVCSWPKSLDSPKSAIFGTILSPNNILLGLRFMWIIASFRSLCRKCKPLQIPKIILKRVGQSIPFNSSERKKLLKHYPLKPSISLCNIFNELPVCAFYYSYG